MADPLAKCYMAGVPRIMYLNFPMQIFQNPRRVSILFEWSQNYRQIYTDGSKGPEGIEFWMGDSRGQWEGDTLVVDVTDHNDKTWFDMAGNFHSEAMQLMERFTLRDADTIDYQVTVTDPKVFTRPWTMKMALYRNTEMSRVLEYDCQAEAEEANGAFPARAAYLVSRSHDDSTHVRVGMITVGAGRRGRSRSLPLLLFPSPAPAQGPRAGRGRDRGVEADTAHGDGSPRSRRLLPARRRRIQLWSREA